MKIKIICVGKMKEKFYRDLMEEYGKKIKKQYPFSCVELNDLPIPKNAGEGQIHGIKVSEGELILKEIKPEDYVIALCIEGKEMKTSAHKAVVKKAIENGSEQIVYVIGGSLGLSEQVVKRANYKLSFSKMTFPHQLMRVVLAEQLTKL